MLFPPGVHCAFVIFLLFMNSIHMFFQRTSTFKILFTRYAFIWSQVFMNQSCVNLQMFCNNSHILFFALISDVHYPCDAAICFCQERIFHMSYTLHFHSHSLVFVDWFSYALFSCVEIIWSSMESFDYRFHRQIVALLKDYKKDLKDKWEKKINYHLLTNPLRYDCSNQLFFYQILKCVLLSNMDLKFCFKDSIYCDCLTGDSSEDSCTQMIFHMCHIQRFYPSTCVCFWYGYVD